MGSVASTWRGCNVLMVLMWDQEGIGSDDDMVWYVTAWNGQCNVDGCRRIDT